jgi:hypothetical protein
MVSWIKKWKTTQGIMSNFPVPLFKRGCSIIFPVTKRGQAKKISLLFLSFMFQIGAKVLFIGAEVFHIGAEVPYVGAKAFQIGAEVLHIGAEIPYIGAEIFYIGAKIFHIGPVILSIGA